MILRLFPVDTRLISDADAARIQAAHSSWWALATRLRKVAKQKPEPEMPE